MSDTGLTPEEREQLRNGVFREICEAYGGDFADPVWHTPEGIASIMEEYSGQARAHAFRAIAAESQVAAVRSASPPTPEPTMKSDNHSPDLASGQRDMTRCAECGRPQSECSPEPVDPTPLPPNCYDSVMETEAWQSGWREGRACEIERIARVTRVEVIDHRAHITHDESERRGRVFTAWDAAVSLAFQDFGETLKVFVDDRASLTPARAEPSEEAGTPGARLVSLLDELLRRLPETDVRPFDSAPVEPKILAALDARLSPAPTGDDAPMKPCPFCGGSARIAHTVRFGCHDGEPDARAYFAGCISCASQGGWAKSEAGALRWWNTRAALPPLRRTEPSEEAIEAADANSGYHELKYGTVRRMLRAAYAVDGASLTPEQPTSEGTET